MTAKNTTTASKPAAKKAAATTQPERVELLPLLLDGLKAEGVTAKPKWAPSKAYANLYVKDAGIGFVHKQTAKGMAVGVALPGSTKAKGFADSKRGGRYGLLGTVTKEAEVALAVAALKLAAEEAAKPKAEKPKAAAKKAAKAEGDSPAVTPNSVVVKRGRKAAAVTAEQKEAALDTVAAELEAAGPALAAAVEDAMVEAGLASEEQAS